MRINAWELKVYNQIRRCHKEKSLVSQKNVFKVKNTNEYSITYSRDDDIYYGRYSDAADVYIRFENYGLPRPEQYSLGWFRNMKMFEMSEAGILWETSNSIDKLAVIFSLLDYLQNNLGDVTNIEFCRKTQNKINEFFEKGLWWI